MIKKMENRYSAWILNEKTPPFQYHETLGALVGTLINPERLKTDLLVAMLFIMMGDNDFLLMKKVGEPTSIIDYFKTRNKHQATYVGMFVLRNFQNTPVKLFAVPIADTMLITAIAPEIQIEAYSICLRMDKYFVCSQWGLPIKFTNFSELFTACKDTISTPIKNTILSYHDYPFCSLCGLPDDVVHKIMIRLSLADIISLSKSCKKIHRIVEEDRLWTQLCKRDFSVNCESQLKDWRDIYREMYLSSLEEKHKMASNIGARSHSAELPDYMRIIPESRWEVIL